MFLVCEICQKRFKNHGGLGTHQLTHQRKGEVTKKVVPLTRGSSSQRRLLATCATSVNEGEGKEERVPVEEIQTVNNVGYYVPNERDEIEAADDSKYDPEEGNDAMEYIQRYRMLYENKDQRRYLDKSAASNAFLGYRSGGPLERLRNLRKEVLLDAKVCCSSILSTLFICY